MHRKQQKNKVYTLWVGTSFTHFSNNYLKVTVYDDYGFLSIVSIRKKEELSDFTIPGNKTMEDIKNLYKTIIGTELKRLKDE